MKNYLVGWRDWETSFGGDQVSAKLLPLNRKDFLQVLPLLDDYYAKNKDKEEGDGLKRAQDMNFLLDGVEDILIKHIKDIRGFQTDGQNPDIKDLVNIAIFVPLLAEMLFSLVEISKIEGEEAKNSKGQSTKEELGE